MNRIFAFALLASVTAFGEEYVSPVTGQPFKEGGRFTLEQIKARDERVMKKTGGFLMQKAEGPRTLLIDTREAEKKTVDEVVRLYKLGAHLDIDIARELRAGKCPLEYAQAKMAEKKPLMLVIVVEKAEAKLPALSVFPEERIGIVNADKLQGGEDPAAPETRVMKEIWRAIGFIGGIGFSQAENDMMQPYYTLKELDGNIQAYIQPMNMAKMQRFLKRFGVKKEAKIPYRVAVMEGWAPSPTNDIQKAVWDEVHAIPKKPVKITYDKDKQKPVVK